MLRKLKLPTFVKDDLEPKKLYIETSLVRTTASYIRLYQRLRLCYMYLGFFSIEKLGFGEKTPVVTASCPLTAEDVTGLTETGSRSVRRSLVCRTFIR